MKTYIIAIPAADWEVTVTCSHGDMLLLCHTLTLGFETPVLAIEKEEAA